MADEDDDLPLRGDDRLDAVVRRAHRRWKRCHDFERIARQNWDNDYKIANGDAYNNYQWPVEIYRDRGSRPSLTVNEIRLHNLHIINEAKQNKASVKFRPTGGGATAASAEVYEGLYRHIANISNAQLAQGMAISFQVQAGLGWTEIVSDYPALNPVPGPDAFNQEIYIRPIKNPMAVMLDCDCEQLDGSGARYGFVFSDEPKDAIEEKYPEMKGKLAVSNGVDGHDAGWIRQDHVRVARYFEVEEEKDELLCDAEGNTVLRSKVPPALYQSWQAEAAGSGTKLKTRELITKKVRCYTIAGNTVVDEADLPGSMVPLVPWVGEVTVINGVLDRKGHTRCMISPQQMANYNWSASVEFGALQSKTPYIMPAKAIGDYMTYWQTANTVNHAFLPYVDRDEEGNEIAPPQRQQPPVSAPVYLEGVNLARQFMMSASGQFEAELGAPGNERSGKAINERQRQAQRATYHFVDNQALSMRRQGEMVLEWAPVVYDTKRVLQILGEDHGEASVQNDPTSTEAHRLQRIGDAVERIFNPRIGSYEVVPDVGPDYATQRQEAFNAIVQILTQAPQLISQIGDILFKVADFPMADKIAERLKPGLPPEFAATLAKMQEEARKIQEEVQHKDKLIGETTQALIEERVKSKNDENEAVVKAFDADTRRMAVAKDMLKDDPALMAMLQPMIADIVMETLRQNMQDDLGPVIGHLTEQVTDEGTGMPVSPDGIQPGLPVEVNDIGEQLATPGGI
tara:strand:- start:1096 stop:3318 length:2223 start_codon:yes stop_codon:yes gene_type:complete